MTRAAVALALLVVATLARASEEGVASWYGREFHGRPTACGETYDSTKMTAAHRTLPFGTYVRVTNLDNGTQATLRVNDRGPFAKGRILDCSEAGAKALGFWVNGTARVRVEPLGALPDASKQPMTRKQRKRIEREVRQARERGEVPVSVLVPVDEDAGPFELQVGAFRDPANAERLLARLTSEGHPGRLVTTGEGFTRVRVGPYATRRAAEQGIAAIDVTEQPFVVRKD